MRWCADHGLPHSYVLNMDQDDRDKLMAYLLEEGTRCPNCGTADWEWDPAQGGDPYAYEAINQVCMGCYRRDIAGEESERTAGSRISLIPAKRAEALKNMKAKLPTRR